MKTTNLMTLAITLTVGIILAGSLLVPVLNDATTTEVKITNIGAYNLTDDDDDNTIIYDPAGKYIIGEKEIPFNTLPGENITIASTEEYMLRMQNFSGQSFNLWIFSIYGDHTVIASSNSQAPLSINFNDGTLTYGTTTKTYTSNDNVRILNPDGAFIMTKANTSATVLKNTTVIVGDGTTAVNQWYNRFYIEGTVEDITVTPTEGITVSDVVVNTTANSKYKEAVTLDSITFTATDGTNTVDATYNRVIVPAEIDAELAQHLAPGEIAILNALPVLIIAALVVMAAGALYLKRDD